MMKWNDLHYHEENKNMELIIERKTVYGNELNYPVCNKAKAFAKLMGTVTLPDEKLSKIKHSLGYDIKLKETTIKF